MTPLHSGQYYHLLHRANGSDHLFEEEGNYFFFLHKFRKHIHPVVPTLACALLGNHFHLVVRVREVDELWQTFPKFRTLKMPDDESKFISKQFSNFFSSYAQAFNKKYARSGSLFQKNLKRHHLNNTAYLLNAIAYVHSNPVHHGFCNRMSDWPFSSYKAYLSAKPALLVRAHGFELFEGWQNFIEFHEAFSALKQAQMEENFEALP